MDEKTKIILIQENRRMWEEAAYPGNCWRGKETSAERLAVSPAKTQTSNTQENNRAWVQDPGEGNRKR
jgi:hypothetical protein